MACNIKLELEGVDLGDARRNRRVVNLAARLAAHPSLSVSGACHGWAESMGAYRLVQNKDVTPEKLLCPHRRATLARAGACGESLLLVQDTTELDYSTYESLRGTGPLSAITRRGFFLHNRLLIAEESGVPLGLCGAEIVTRSDAEHGLGEVRKKKLPLEAKESMRWMNGYNEACAVAAELPAQEVIMVADRECDIYDIFAKYHDLAKEGAPHAQFVIRAKADRRLGGGATLFDTALCAPLLGAYDLEVTPQPQLKKTPTGSRHRHQRAGRTAKMEVRAIRVKVPPPTHSKQERPPVELTVVVAREAHPPEGQEGILWFLVSNLAVDTLEQANRLLRIYALRWRVEEFHRILKTGCRVEALSFVEAGSIQALLALYMVVAWRILYLRDFARATPQTCGSVLFTEQEWKSACIIRKQSLERVPSVGEMMVMVAIFGGYLARKSDPPPGPERLWRGLVALHHYTEMATALGAV